MARRQRNEKLKLSKSVRKAAAKNPSKYPSKNASKSTLKAKSKAASRPACHFFRIPLEIRHKIYGYLLLDPPCAWLRKKDEDVKSDSSAYDSSDYGNSDFDDQMLALSHFNPYGMEMGDMNDGIFNEVYNGMYNGGGIAGSGYGMFGDFDDQSDVMDFDLPDPFFSTFIDDGEEIDYEGGRSARLLGKSLPTRAKEMKLKRHLAILRTNRQIYNEASTLLHSDLTILMSPGDALIDTPGNAIVERTENLWRHSPSNKLHSAKPNGQTMYTTPSLDGVLDPYVFARFGKISYDGLFDFSMADDAPSLHINDDLRACAQDEHKFVSYLTATKNITRWYENPLPAGRADNGLRETLQDVADITFSRAVVTQPSVADVIQKFVTLISKSPIIRHLELTLQVEVRCSNGTRSIDHDSIDSEEEAKLDEKWYVADERATELFLEAGVLNSLRSLSNVMSFSLTIETFGRTGEFMKPKKKYLNIIRDLKSAIERNWVVEHGPH